jgi:hypothetical protein
MVHHPVVVSPDGDDLIDDRSLIGNNQAARYREQDEQEGYDESSHGSPPRPFEFNPPEFRANRPKLQAKTIFAGLLVIQDKSE